MKKGFTSVEKDAMKARVKEAKGETGESDVLAKIAEMKQPDRAMAERFHALVKATAPELTARTWYGMPAYAKNGETICFFQSGQKFKARYATIGFSDKAKLDDGSMWPSAFAVKDLDEARLAALIKKAVS
jgi:uncharacterized protein YdhG (YjbR/CyaY superfamily)